MSIHGEAVISIIDGARRWEPVLKERTVSTHKQHVSYLSSLSSGGQNAEVLMIGSSMFERFFTSGRSHLPEFGHRKVAICGVGGDGIQHMLWRLDNGLIEACPASLHTVILLAGTNNIEQFSHVDVLAGVCALLDRIWAVRPEVDIQLYSMLPRTSTRRGLSNADLMVRIGKFNELQALLPDAYNARRGHGTGQLKFINIHERFLLGMAPNPTLFDDHVHLNTAGYDLFARELFANIPRDAAPGSSLVPLDGAGAESGTPETQQKSKRRVPRVQV
eukprot:NODE_3256_length_1013_cov_86.139004_g2994_i0.p1 GENE.NODE_3256_length_1013_cov_86.139004_g2994_i0~~NODE_3256_length_1013_cov_86.139004_g2994_i0.p1  ORF type:complete len:275 (-),score=35.11 NODE_3256_length_1013_cov_86.139004_g2994_i0:94-918(-)